MKLTYISIKNYRCFKELNLNLNEINCFIGKNNSGKSTFLRALEMIFSFSKPSIDDFLDKTELIQMQITLSDINDFDLQRIDENNRSRYEPLVYNREMKFKFEYSVNNESVNLNILINELLPKDSRLNVNNLNLKLATISGRQTSEFWHSFLLDNFGIKAENQLTSKESVKQEFNSFLENLDSNDKDFRFGPLHSGVDNSLKPFFPKTIFIEAVKDFSDEMKCKSATTFGKLQNILLLELKEKFEENIFEKFDKTVENSQEIKNIEEELKDILSDSFKVNKIKINVPTPNLDDIFSKITMNVDDGFDSDFNEKGDGLRRAILFSMIKMLNKVETMNEDLEFKGEYIFLFEEPELYLHPQAQNILFESLVNLAKFNQVFFSTHSPMFLSPENINNFIKFTKDDISNPITKAFPIDLSDVEIKDKFQLISYESNNHAFFSKKVLLVEGDSEIILLPILAKKINPEWNFKSKSIGIIQTGGKDSMKRYKDFFSIFDIEVFILCDLDILLRSYNKIDPDSKYLTLKNDLLQKVDESIENQSKPKTRKYKKVLERGESGSLFELIKKAREEENIDKVYELMEEFYSFEYQEIREKILQKPNDEIKDIKNELFESLKQDNIFILSLGEIEDYYDSSIEGIDKPTKALNFCKFILDRNNLFDWLDDSDLATMDFNNLFSALFN